VVGLLSTSTSAIYRLAGLLLLKERGSRESGGALRRAVATHVPQRHNTPQTRAPILPAFCDPRRLAKLKFSKSANETRTLCPAGRTALSPWALYHSYRVQWYRSPREAPLRYTRVRTRGVPQRSLVQKAQNAIPHDQGALMAWDKKEKAQEPRGSRGEWNFQLREQRRSP
jgi:hypothetical protein